MRENNASAWRIFVVDVRVFPSNRQMMNPVFSFSLGIFFNSKYKQLLSWDDLMLTRNKMMYLISVFPSSLRLKALSEVNRIFVINSVNNTDYYVHGFYFLLNRVFVCLSDSKY
jgi:hypothetical protein